jgi:UDP-N-acetylglucosamine 2-epimerase
VNKIKVTTILGTRPELIRLSRIISRMDEVFEHRLFHTGQNHDSQLSDIFFRELGIRNPDVQLSISTATLGSFLGDLFKELEIELIENRPDAVMILGDTNSSLAGIIAKRLGIPVYHLEAGNRSFDQNVPEEINRRVIDHFSDFNLPYTSHAKENLVREGIHSRNISVIGSPLNEVLNSFKEKIDSSNILEILKISPKKYFLVSAHRQENVDNPKRLGEVVEALNRIAEEYKYPVIVSTHPRTRIKLENLKARLNPLVKLSDPFGFFDYNKLQLEARAVLSDSGSISEESAILGFPAITIRDSMERPEALESGSILMSGISAAGIIECLRILEKSPASMMHPQEYAIPDSSTRVINFIASTVRQHSFWSGLRKF